MTEQPISNPTSEGAKEATKIYSGMASTLIMIIAKSGRGKTTAIAPPNSLAMDPTNTHIITPVGKALPFMGARKFYENEGITVSADSNTIRRKMNECNKNPSIKNIIIDDAQYIMATEFMDKAMVKGYDKWSIMARNFWEILILSTKLRPDMKVFLLTHEEATDYERKMKTLGKLLDDKITPEGLSTIVLYGEVGGSKDVRTYFFTTQSDGHTNAKSPAGMFPKEIPNSLRLIAERIDEYYDGIPLSKSRLNFNIK